MLYHSINVMTNSSLPSILKFFHIFLSAPLGRHTPFSQREFLDFFKSSVKLLTLLHRRNKTFYLISNQEFYFNYCLYLSCDSSLSTELISLLNPINVLDNTSVVPINGLINNNGDFFSKIFKDSS